MLTKSILTLWLLFDNFEKFTSINLWTEQSQHFKPSSRQCRQQIEIVNYYSELHRVDSELLEIVNYKEQIVNYSMFKRSTVKGPSISLQMRISQSYRRATKFSGLTLLAFIITSVKYHRKNIECKILAPYEFLEINSL